MLKLNVGLSRKVGEANYGSRGASVNLELELDTGLVREPDRLQERIRYLFRLAKASVDEELSGGQPNGSQGEAGELHTHGGGQRNSNGQHATQSQVRAIHAIANRERVDLSALLHERFQAARPDDLSISQASELIDFLKPEANGVGGRR